MNYLAICSLHGQAMIVPVGKWMYLTVCPLRNWVMIAKWSDHDSPSERMVSPWPGFNPRSWQKISRRFSLADHTNLEKTWVLQSNASPSDLSRLPNDQHGHGSKMNYCAAWEPFSSNDQQYTDLKSERMPQWCTQVLQHERLNMMYTQAAFQHARWHRHSYIVYPEDSTKHHLNSASDELLLDSPRNGPWGFYGVEWQGHRMAETALGDMS